MSELPPPVLEESPTGRRFAIRAATFSIIAPVVAFLIDVFINPSFHSIGLLIIAIELLLIVLGLVLAIMALTATKRHGRKSIFVKALVGIIINGLLVVLLVVLALAFLPIVLNPTTSQTRLDKANKELAVASTDENRFYALDDAAKESFEVGKIEDARKYATELLALAQKFQGDWNYGNAIQDGNLVLGRIAARDGQIEEAKKYLL